MNARMRQALGLESRYQGQTPFGVDLTQVARLDPAHIPADLAEVTICGVTAKRTAQAPTEYVNVQETNGVWYVDWVRGQSITALGRRPTQKGAMTYARSRAMRLGLTVRTGPVTLPALESAKAVAP